MTGRIKSVPLPQKRKPNTANKQMPGPIQNTMSVFGFAESGAKAYSDQLPVGGF